MGIVILSFAPFIGKLVIGKYFIFNYITVLTMLFTKKKEKNTDRIDISVKFQLYCLGVSLWVPGFAIFSIEDLWGLQIAACVFITLLITLVIGYSSKAIVLTSINTYQEWILAHTVFFISIILCTMFSTVSIERSSKTFVVELIGLMFSITTTWWLCQNTKNFMSFMAGFKLGGLISSIYAIYQLIGLRINLPFAYIEMNNSSFSLVGLEYSEDILRSFGFTPEPSILASLLWVMVGIALCDLMNVGGIKLYLIFSCVLMGLLSTSSQSIPLLPLYITVIGFINYKYNRKMRSFMASDLMGGSIMISAMLVLLLTNESILFWLSRAGSFDSNNTSGEMRLNDIIVGMQMFNEYPIFGLGLGCSSDLMAKFSSKMNISTQSGGITSGFIRVVAEQGMIGLTSLVISSYCMFPFKLERLNLSYWLTLPKNKKGKLRSKRRKFSYQLTPLEPPDSSIEELPQRAIVPLPSLSIIGYQASFIISGILSFVLFVGYRNLYHLWIVLPMGIAMKSHIRLTEEQ
jgi:hypothetical protein